MTDQEHDPVSRMVRAVTREHLTEGDYKAAVERGRIAPCETGMQLTSAEYAKGWQDCRTQVMRFLEELQNESAVASLSAPPRGAWAIADGEGA